MVVYAVWDRVAGVRFSAPRRSLKWKLKELTNKLGACCGFEEGVAGVRFSAPRQL